MLVVITSIAALIAVVIPTKVIYLAVVLVSQPLRLFRIYAWWRYNVNWEIRFRFFLLYVRIAAFLEEKYNQKLLRGIARRNAAAERRGQCGTTTGKRLNSTKEKHSVLGIR